MPIKSKAKLGEGNPIIYILLFFWSSSFSFPVSILYKLFWLLVLLSPKFTDEFFLKNSLITLLIFSYIGE